jgi:predicted cobalt transporter CbtA
LAVTFTAITKSAVLEARATPRQLDMELIDAYLARRALDYLVGFTLSPVLWRKLPGLVLVVVPQWVGAPKAVGAEDLVPAAMALNFVTVALLTSGVFWVLMGAVGGHLFYRLVRPKH